ncbi:hypothetical protein [gamma proteobacterium L18]
MRERIYPYTAWLLTRSFQPLQIELIGPGYAASGYDRTESGRNYHVDELYPSLAAAIACGEGKLAELAADIAKRQASLDKRRDALARFK